MADDVKEYIEKAVSAFDLYLSRHAGYYAAWDISVRANLLALRIREIGMGVAAAGGTEEDAAAVAADIWTAIVKNLVICGVRLHVSGLPWVRQKLLEGYRKW